MEELVVENSVSLSVYAVENLFGLPFCTVLAQSIALTLEAPITAILAHCIPLVASGARFVSQSHNGRIHNCVLRVKGCDSLS